MLKLYHQGSSVCAAKVRVVLGEKELEWESEYVDVLKGEQFAFPIQILLAQHDPDLRRADRRALMIQLQHRFHPMVPYTAGRAAPRLTFVTGGGRILERKLMPARHPAARFRLVNGYRRLD